MKIFPDLKEGEAVQFDDAFLIHLASGTYEIDGSELSVHYGGRQIMVNSMDNVYRITKTNPVHIGFRKDGKPFGNFDTWKELTAINRSYYENGYPSLDEEFRLRSELKKYAEAEKVMSEPETTKTKIEIPIVGRYVNTGSDFIESALFHGNVSFNGRGAFKINASAIARDEVEQLRKKYPTIENSTHSGLRYLKAGSNYVFNDTDEAHYGFIKNESLAWLVNTIEEAHAKEKHVRSIVRNHVLLKLEPKDLGEVVPPTLGDIFNNVKNALNAVYKLSPMKHSQTDRANAITYLTKARDAILTANESSVSG